MYLDFLVGLELGFDKRLSGEGTYASLLRQPQPNHLPIKQLREFGQSTTLGRTNSQAKSARRWKLGARIYQKTRKENPAVSFEAGRSWPTLVIFPADSQKRCSPLASLWINGRKLLVSSSDTPPAHPIEIQTIYVMVKLCFHPHTTSSLVHA